jgi:hypothetical protein
VAEVVVVVMGDVEGPFIGRERHGARWEEGGAVVVAGELEDDV